MKPGPPPSPEPAAAPPPARVGYSLRRVLLTCMVVGAAAAVAGGTYSAFSGTTSNTGNSFASGTVTLGDNDSGPALLSLSNAKPNDSSTGCIKVTYTGSRRACASTRR